MMLNIARQFRRQSTDYIFEHTKVEFSQASYRVYFLSAFYEYFMVNFYLIKTSQTPKVKPIYV